MEEENKTEEKPSFVDEMKKAKAELDESLKIADKLARELRDLKAEDIMSGKAEAPTQEKVKESDPKDYAKAALEGKPLEK